MLHDQQGIRKYLTATERSAFMRAANQTQSKTETFCLTLAYTGARISEVLRLTPLRIDASAHFIVFESLKQRRKGVFRAVPVPDALLTRLETVHGISGQRVDTALRSERLWPWGRTKAWTLVKEVMRAANIAPEYAMPKALRHAFGVGGAQAGISLAVMQRWMGHARIETTAIYTQVIGEEEQALARRMWL